MPGAHDKKARTEEGCSVDPLSPPVLIHPDSRFLKAFVFFFADPLNLSMNVAGLLRDLAGCAGAVMAGTQSLIGMERFWVGSRLSEAQEEWRMK
jgi:hypothetical protein